MPLRVVFMGTAELARASLEALLADVRIDVPAVVTQPDRPKGRDLRPHSSPVKESALHAGRPVLQPARARDPQFIQTLAEIAPELIVVAAFGQILPQAILDIPRHGCLNVHASLLPKYRGAAPIQWAILNGELETGVTIMKMNAALDAGEIVSRRAIKIGPDETGAQLHDRLAALGADLLLSTVPQYIAGELRPRPQDDSAATYAPKITKEDGRIDWFQPAAQLRNRLRAFTPWPGLYVTWRHGERAQLLKFWRATVQPRQGEPGTILSNGKEGLIIACGEDALRIEELQLEGARRMSAAEFLAGHRLQTGEKLA